MIEAPILCYHHVAEPTVGAPESTFLSPARFRRHIGLLARMGWRGVSIAEIGRALAQGRALPPRSVAITFDDGWRDVFDVARPVLEQFGFRATVFVVSGSIGQTDAVFTESRLQAPGRMMDAAALRALAEAGWEIGAHSRTHRHLTRLGPDGAAREIADSRRAIETFIERPVEVFAYPYGDFHGGLARMVEGAGFAAACSMIPGRRHRPNERFTLRRVPIGHDMGAARLFWAMRFRPYRGGDAEMKKRLAADWPTGDR